MSLGDRLLRNFRLGDVSGLEADIMNSLDNIGGNPLREESPKHLMFFMFGYLGSQVDNVYVIYPNVEEGGFCSLSFIPKYSCYRSLPGVIIGFDVSDTADNMTATARNILKKTDDCLCDRLLKKLGAGRIDRYGMAYWNKRVRVVKQNL